MENVSVTGQLRENWERLGKGLRREKNPGLPCQGVT